MHFKIIQITDNLRKRFLNESQNLNEISIFLCGGGSPEHWKFRRAVGEKISCIRSKYRYSVYYPEDMFIELILGHQKKDLLSLENLLADSVNAVVILVQSPGTFTELGAFTNYEKLSDKLIVIIDPRFARSRSFINLGPVRYLKDKTRSKVLSMSMDDSNLDVLVEHVVSASREIAKHSSPVRNLSNPISAYRFYLALIYIFEPVLKENILGIAGKVATNRERNTVTAAETVINSLISERKIYFPTGNLSVTPKGVKELIYSNETRKRSREILSFLTEQRLEALNLTLRKNYKGVWGEAELS